MDKWINGRKEGREKKTGGEERRTGGEGNKGMVAKETKEWW